MLPPDRDEHAEQTCPSFHTSRCSFIRQSGSRRRKAMQVIHERWAALDVHKKTVVVTIMLTQADGRVQPSTRTFLPLTADLLALNDWLSRHNIEVIALESTGVFWRPGVNLIEEGRQVI